MQKGRVKYNITVSINGENLLDPEVRFEIMRILDLYSRDYDICKIRDDYMECKMECWGNYWIYEGCRTMPNGDPGYPDEYEEELDWWYEDLEVDLKAAFQDYDIMVISDEGTTL